MNIIVFGSTDLTFSILEFLYQNNYKIVAIVTVPQVFKISYKPDGFNNTRFVDLHVWGIEHSIPTINYKSADQLIDDLNSLKIKADFGIVAGWYHMLSKKIRNFFPKGCGGFHTSLLPQLRGGAPLNWSILLGCKETGVSFFKLDEGVDDGLLFMQKKFPIETADYIEDLIKKSEQVVLSILKKCLPKIIANDYLLYKQNGIPSYSCQRLPEDGKINWVFSAMAIDSLIRATSYPYPGAYTFLNKEKIIIWKSDVIKDYNVFGQPGQIFTIRKEKNIPTVITGEKLLVIEYATNEIGDDVIEILKSSHYQRFSNE